MSDFLARDRQNGIATPHTTLESYTEAFPFADADALATHLAIVRTSSTFAREIESLVRELGFDLSRPRYSIVRALYLAPDHAMAQSDLAQALGVSGPNVTQLIDGLVAGGWVERVVSPVDRRVVYACLTAEGEKRAERLVPAVVEFMVQSCSSLSREEVTELRRLLEKVQEGTITRRSLTAAGDKATD